MKKAIHFLFVAMAIALLACQSTQQENKTVILSGKIENPKSDKVLFILSDFPDDIVMDTAFLKPDGTFKISIELLKCQHVTLNDLNEMTQMYLCPGDSVFITLNTERFDESIHYEGAGSDKNNILAEYFLKFKNAAGEYYIDFFDIKDTSITIFIDLVNSQADQMEAYIHQLEKNHDLPPEFVNYMKTEVYFTRTSNLASLFRSRNVKLDTSEFYQSRLKEVKETILNAGKNIHPDFSNGQFLNWLTYDAEWRINDEIFDEFDGLHGAQFDSVSFQRFQPYLPPDMFQYYLKYKAKVYRSSYEPDLLESMRSILEQYATDTVFRDSICKEYADRIQKVNQPIPGDAILTDLNDEEFKGLSTKDVLGKYRGKVIYLDFWSSSCGPCVTEMPYSTELARKFQDQDVVFIYFSLDYQKAPWERAIRYLQQDGVHYRLNDRTGGQTFQDFGGTFIPHYVLIDKSGNIVNKNMSRPGEPETEKAIRALL